jgi:hypothetical protein
LRQKPNTVDASRSFLASIADLITVKGVVLILYLSVITGVSVVAGRAAHGFLPAVGLTVLLAGAVAFDYLHYGRLDYVGVSSVVVAGAYTALEYAGVLQNLWFPVSASVLLLFTSGYQAWRDDVNGAAEFVEHLDVVGLHGGVLLLLYSLLLAGAPLEFIYAPVFPAVLLFFAVSLLVTTIAYATRSASVTSDELHHRLVSVVRGLKDIEDDEDRQKLAEHVRAVAQALSGVAVPSRVRVEDGAVPVVLPATPPPVYEADGVEDLTRRVRETGVTGYAVDGGDVMLFKNGTPTRYYLDEEDRFGHPDVLPDGRFEEPRLYPAAYVFVDAVESVVPEPGKPVEGEEWAQDAVERVEDVQEDVDTLLNEGDPDDRTASTQKEGTEESDDPEDDETDDAGKIDVGGDELDLDEMFEKADEMFD